jgi:RNA polymerase sigma-70 factor (ECF subfamily)
MGEQIDDRALVVRIVAGEHELFSELVARYEKRILNYVYRIIHRYEDAHDLTQEIFIKVFMALDRYDPKYQFSTWIFRIAQNSAIDTLRKRSLPEVSLTKSGPNDEEGKEREIPDDGISPYRDLKNKELSVAIDEAIVNLPTDYRELIQLRHFGELSYEEIADLKEMPLGTVKNKLFRARNMLKDTLSHYLEPI